jgi:ferredoxin
MDKNDVRCRVKIRADLQWLLPPKDSNEAMLRDQAGAKLQALATALERSVAQMLEDIAPRVRY